MYTITGATGNIGNVIADSLLSRGKQVRVIGRDEKRLKRFAERGADILAGSVEDASFLRKAFEGATAVFAMIPPDPQTPDLAKQQDGMGEAISSAIKFARVPNVVNLSSVGAEVDADTGPIAGLRRQEHRLNQLDANILHLTPTYFMENFVHNIGMIKHMGINGSPIHKDVSLGMIATRDIGNVAAERLLRLDFVGKTRQILLGPKNLTMVEATKILGQSIGKPDLPYVEFSYDDAEKGMIQAGLSPDIARSFNRMYRSFNEKKIGPYERNAQNTTPTTMEEFARQVFAPAFQAA